MATKPAIPSTPATPIAAARSSQPQRPGTEGERLRELVAYLLMLYGRERRGALIEIRYRDPNQHERMLRRWHHVAQPARAARDILALGQSSDTYIGVAPRHARHGGRSAVKHTWVLWVDVDDRAAISNPPPIAPGIAITSGNIRSRPARSELCRGVPVGDMSPTGRDAVDTHCCIPRDGRGDVAVARGGDE